MFDDSDGVSMIVNQVRKCGNAYLELVTSDLFGIVNCPALENAFATFYIGDTYPKQVHFHLHVNGRILR